MADPAVNRVAYRDEYPWIRCSCGYILGSSNRPCPDCGVESATVDYRDRFAPVPTTDTEGHTYRPVPYEDAYRRTF
jgi:hypothetical protein